MDFPLALEISIGDSNSLSDLRLNRNISPGQDPEIKSFLPSLLTSANCGTNPIHQSLGTLALPDSVEIHSKLEN